jgi:hypothetical protein
MKEFHTQMKMKKILHLSLILLMVVSFSAAPLEAFALPECHYEHNTFNGEDLYKPGSLEASYVDYIQGVWKCDTRLAGRGGLCGRWSNLVRGVVSASSSEKYYYALRFNRTNFLKVCKGCKPGTKLVLGQAKSENGTLSHAIVLLKVTSKKVWWADCNWNHDNVIHYRRGTVRDFINFYHYKSSKYSYLHFVVKINKYRRYSAPKIAASETVDDGTARVVWTKTSGATKYNVYRSISKKGTFRKIAETKACSYTDSTAKAGKTYYYKVAAVKSNGKKKWSGKAAAKTRLNRPHTSLRYPKGKRGRLVWNAVPGAKCYVVYRKYDGGKWKKVITTKRPLFISKYIKRGNKYWYTVKAISKTGKGANSKFSPWITTMNYAWVP